MSCHAECPLSQSPLFLLLYPVRLGSVEKAIPSPRGGPQPCGPGPGPEIWRIRVADFALGFWLSAVELGFSMGSSRHFGNGGVS